MQETEEFSAGGGRCRGVKPNLRPVLPTRSKQKYSLICDMIGCLRAVSNILDIQYLAISQTVGHSIQASLIFKSYILREEFKCDCKPVIYLGILRCSIVFSQCLSRCCEKTYDDDKNNT